MKSSQAIEVVAVLDHSLGWLRRTEGKSLAGVDLAPAAAASLTRLKERGARICVLVPEPVGRTSLALLRSFVEPLVDEVEATTLDRFRRRRRKRKGDAWFVAADRMWRAAAARAGYRAVAHVRLAELEAGGKEIRFARIRGGREELGRLTQGVPYDLERTERGDWALLGAFDRDAIAAAILSGCEVQTLPLNMAEEEPYWIQVPFLEDGGKAELPGLDVLLAEPGRMLLALGPDRTVDSLPFHGVHGHFRALLPDPELLQSPPAAPELEFRGWPRDRIEVQRLPLDIDDILVPLLDPCPGSAAELQADVNRYSGVAPLHGSGPLVSRHTGHPHNALAVDGLIADLRAIGYCAYRHSFVLNGTVHHNVIADLPGTGFFRIHPDIRERVREVLIRWPLLGREAMSAITEIVGKPEVDAWKLPRLDPRAARLQVEKVFGLRPCFPWWLRLCPLPGPGAQIVLVGCHLDSTASRDFGYDPASDAAPGADDDASGIAGVLAIARSLWGRRGTLRHTVRFCFFNAEESGLVGSKAYAAMLKAAGAPVRGVVCMDMVGYNGDAARSWEVHAGYTDPAVRDLSLPLATAVETSGASIGALPPIQIYQGTNGGSGADRTVFDGAINRSDHASFHEQGYPAVVVSEDFFVNLASESSRDPNPHYHQGADTVIDAAYASDIVCAVSMAVHQLAQG